jgi:hypothetical protein
MNKHKKTPNTIQQKNMELNFNLSFNFNGYPQNSIVACNFSMLPTKEVVIRDIYLPCADVMLAVMRFCVENDRQS